MSTTLSESQLNDIFKRTDEAMLVLESDYFIDADQAALDMIDVS